MSEEKAETTEKPLEKMTVKALREMAKDIPEITGVHGMKKDELIKGQATGIGNPVFYVGAATGRY